MPDRRGIEPFAGKGETMRATVMHKAHDVRVESVADAAIQKPTDAVIRVIRACICGSDLWPYNGGPNVSGQRGSRPGTAFPTAIAR